MDIIYLIIDKSEDTLKLKFLDKNHPLWVKGELSVVEENSVTLINGKIKIE